MSHPRPTRRTIQEIRSDVLYRYAVERRDQIDNVDDLRALCPSWSPTMVADAIDRNIARGRFDEGPTGRLSIVEVTR